MKVTINRNVLFDYSKIYDKDCSADAFTDGT